MNEHQKVSSFNRREMSRHTIFQVQVRWCKSNLLFDLFVGQIEYEYWVCDE